MSRSDTFLLYERRDNTIYLVRAERVVDDHGNTDIVKDEVVGMLAYPKRVFDAYFREDEPARMDGIVHKALKYARHKGVPVTLDTKKSAEDN